MELRRKAYDDLLRWKRVSNGSVAFLIEGARYVGKTYLAESFGKNEYDSCITIDFADDGPAYGKLFEDDTYDLDIFFNKLMAMKGVQLYRRRSLIILDGVQHCPIARQRVKILVADGRYDYVETGTLLSVSASADNILIPSEEFRFKLHPLDLEEFLWAMGDEATVPYLRRCFDECAAVGSAVHGKMMNRLREYILVGGMPEAVSVYADTKDLGATDRIKRSILDGYRADMGRCGRATGARLISIFDNVPEQLSKREKKFKLSSVSINARSRDYNNSFFWLFDSSILERSSYADDPDSAAPSWSNLMKCYMEDTGLLTTHAHSGVFADNPHYGSVLGGGLNSEHGMLTENYVAQSIVPRHKLFFYSRHKNGDDLAMEIDFLIMRDGKICPVEVKSSVSSRHVSLDRFRKRFGKRAGQPYVLCPKDVKVSDGIVYLPLYMAMFL